MINNFYYFEKNIFNFQALLRNHSIKTYSVNKITISLNFYGDSNLKNLNILKSIVLIEFIINKKIKVKTALLKNRVWNITIIASLKKYEINNFIFLLNTYIFPVLKRRNLFINKKITTKGGYNFKFKEINLFPNIPHTFLNINPEYHVNFSFKEKNKKINFFCLNMLGLKGIV